MKKFILTFLISMVPLIELRGAIPIGKRMGVSLPDAVIISMIGNMVPMPFIFFFARKVLEWGKDKPVIGGFFRFCLEKGHKGGEKLKKKAGSKGDFKKSVIAVVSGVALAAAIISIVTVLGFNIFT